MAKIASTPALRAEAERQYPALVDALRPASDMELLQILTREAPGLGIPGRDREEWGELFASYLKRLSDLPVEAIEVAFDGWHHAKLYPKDIGRHVFFPKDVEIRALAEPHLASMRMASYRARKAVEHTDPGPYRYTPEFNRAEHAKMIEMGLLTPDGLPNFEIKTREMPLGRKLDQHEVAAQLRASADDSGIVL